MYVDPVAGETPDYRFEFSRFYFCKAMQQKRQGKLSFERTKIFPSIFPLREGFFKKVSSCAKGPFFKNTGKFFHVPGIAFLFCTTIVSTDFHLK